MAKVTNRFGGGFRTNANGIYFEQTTSLDETLRNVGYTVENCRVYNGTEPIGMSVPKRNLYSMFPAPNGIDYSTLNSKQWQPDECFINYDNQTAYIIEKKFQNSSGSVDEKLPGCQFKRQEYEKLFHPLGYEVEYLYVFNDWFRDPQYQDTLEYIEATGCHYFLMKYHYTFCKLAR